MKIIAGIIIIACFVVVGFIDGNTTQIECETGILQCNY